MPELCQADFDVEGFRKLPMDFDPLEVLRATRVPVLVLQGAEDDLVPGPQAADLLSGFASEHDLELQVRLIAGAGHGLRQRNGVRFDTEKGWLEPAWQWPEPYWSALETWLHAHTASNPRRGVAAEPPEMVR